MSEVPEPAINYAESHDASESGLPSAKVFLLRPKRAEAPGGQHEPTQTATPDVVRKSGTRLTLSDIPGDWSSITTVWTDTPDSIQQAWSAIREGLHSGQPDQIADAIWRLIVIAPRAALHLGSWVLDDIFRSGAVLVALGATCLILAI